MLASEFLRKYSTNVGRAQSPRKDARRHEADDGKTSASVRRAVGTPPTALPVLTRAAQRPSAVERAPHLGGGGVSSAQFLQATFGMSGTSGERNDETSRSLRGGDSPSWGGFRLAPSRAAAHPHSRRDGHPAMQLPHAKPLGGSPSKVRPIAPLTSTSTAMHGTSVRPSAVRRVNGGLHQGSSVSGATAGGQAAPPPHHSGGTDAAAAAHSIYDHEFRTTTGVETVATRWSTSSALVMAGLHHSLFRIDAMLQALNSNKKFDEVGDDAASFFLARAKRAEGEGLGTTSPGHVVLHAVDRLPEGVDSLRHLGTPGVSPDDVMNMTVSSATLSAAATSSTAPGRGSSNGNLRGGGTGTNTSLADDLTPSDDAATQLRDQRLIIETLTAEVQRMRQASVQLEQHEATQIRLAKDATAAMHASQTEVKALKHEIKTMSSEAVALKKKMSLLEAENHDLLSLVRSGGMMGGGGGLAGDGLDGDSLFDAEDGRGGGISSSPFVSSRAANTPGGLPGGSAAMNTRGALLLSGTLATSFATGGNGPGAAVWQTDSTVAGHALDPPAMDLDVHVDDDAGDDEQDEVAAVLPPSHIAQMRTRLLAATGASSSVSDVISSSQSKRRSRRGSVTSAASAAGSPLAKSAGVSQDAFADSHASLIPRSVSRAPAFVAHSFLASRRYLTSEPFGSAGPKSGAALPDVTFVAIGVQGAAALSKNHPAEFADALRATWRILREVSQRHLKRPFPLRKSAYDALFAFPSVVDAVSWCLDLQVAMVQWPRWPKCFETHPDAAAADSEELGDTENPVALWCGLRLRMGIDVGPAQLVGDPTAACFVDYLPVDSVGSLPVAADETAEGAPASATDAFFSSGGYDRDHKAYALTLSRVSFGGMIAVSEAVEARLRELAGHDDVALDVLGEPLITPHCMLSSAVERKAIFSIVPRLLKERVGDIRRTISAATAARQALHGLEADDTQHHQGASAVPTKVSDDGGGNSSASVTLQPSSSVQVEKSLAPMASDISDLEKLLGRVQKHHRAYAPIACADGFLEGDDLLPRRGDDAQIRSTYPSGEGVTLVAVRMDGADAIESAIRDGTVSLAPAAAQGGHRSRSVTSMASAGSTAVTPASLCAAVNDCFYDNVEHIATVTGGKIFFRAPRRPPTTGDTAAFIATAWTMAAFPTLEAAWAFASAVDSRLLTADWPREIIDHPNVPEAKTLAWRGRTVFRGPRAAIGLQQLGSRKACRPRFDAITGTVTYAGGDALDAVALCAFAGAGQILATDAAAHQLLVSLAAPNAAVPVSSLELSAVRPAPLLLPHVIPLFPINPLDDGASSEKVPLRVIVPRDMVGRCFMWREMDTYEAYVGTEEYRRTCRELLALDHAQTKRVASIVPLSLPSGGTGNRGMSTPYHQDFFVGTLMVARCVRRYFAGAQASEQAIADLAAKLEQNLLASFDPLRRGTALQHDPLRWDVVECRMMLQLAPRITLGSHAALNAVFEPGAATREYDASPRRLGDSSGIVGKPQRRKSTSLAPGVSGVAVRLRRRSSLKGPSAGASASVVSPPTPNAAAAGGTMSHPATTIGSNATTPGKLRRTGSLTLASGSVTAPPPHTPNSNHIDGPKPTFTFPVEL